MKKINVDQIISIVSKTTKIPKKQININSKSSDFYRWDSLAQVSIIIEIEKKTKKKIKTSKIGELTSIKKIIKYLNY